MKKRKHAAQKPVTVTFFTPPLRPELARYIQPPEEEVTVDYMAPEEEDDCPWDFENTIPPGYVRKGDYVIACSWEDIQQKYHPVTLDARTWTCRAHMYQALRTELGFTFERGENLEGLEAELIKSIHRITILWGCVPTIHMRDYFDQVLWMMYDYDSLDRVYSEDERDEIEDWLEVDFAAGDNPDRPFRNPPRTFFDIPDVDDLW